MDLLILFCNSSKYATFNSILSYIHIIELEMNNFNEIVKVLSKDECWVGEEKEKMEKNDPCNVS